MTPIRQRMIEDMQLRGFSATTQDVYLGAVRRLAEHYWKSPDQLSHEELRQYFLYLTNDRKLARATITIALCAIKFFYEQTLQREWKTLRFIRPRREKKLPVVLSRREVGRILAEVKIPVYRACLTTIYCCGLRLMEGVRLQIYTTAQFTQPHQPQPAPLLSTLETTSSLPSLPLKSQGTETLPWI